MNPGKRAAEATESSPIGSEKRIKESEDQPGQPIQLRLIEFNEFLLNIRCSVLISNDSTDDEFFYEDGEFGSELEYWAVKSKPTDCLSDDPRKSNYCTFCKQVPDHPRSEKDCIVFKRLCPDRPPPTSEDIDKKRRYCSVCVGYVDHGRSDCPTEARIGGYRRLEDGSIQYFLCCVCRREKHSGDCPPTPPTPPRVKRPDDDDYDPYDLGLP